MKNKYYNIQTQVDHEGVAHLPYATVELLVEVPYSKLAPSANEKSCDPDEMLVAIGIAEDVVRAKYPIENASYNLKKPTLELDPASIIGRDDFITASNGSKGWLISRS